MNDYSRKSIAELEYIKKDAYEAAKCAQALGNAQAESRYLDELNDATTELYNRRKEF